jgi:vacuolar-type H+-ATPase subunit I/STV1
LKAARIESLVWVLIYGGLLACAVGIALWRAGEVHGAGLIAFGIIAALAGIVLIFVRSRMPEPRVDARPEPATPTITKESP